MGISPRIFGPYMWATIHYICLGAPEQLNQQEKDAYYNFFNNLPLIMPCHSCGVHLVENLKKHPINPYLNTKKDLFKWSVELHNIVNKQTNKKEITLDEAYNIWMKNIPSLGLLSQDIISVQEEIITVKEKKNNLLLIIIGLLIIILLIINVFAIFFNSKKNQMGGLEIRKLRNRS